MQSRLFTIFMTLTISPPLIQQLQPRYLNFRQVYKSRESNSKIYSWVAFVIGAILPEIPYSFVAGVVYFNTWVRVFFLSYPQSPIPFKNPLY
jgi:ATP-binding cassette, subfamily G (WHITE), member 2, SNQ2